MVITVKTQSLEPNAISSFETILLALNIVVSDFVDEIIICDDYDLEQNIGLVDKTVSLTKNYGCRVLGKTISKGGKTFIFLVTEILNAIKMDLNIAENDKVSIGTNGLRALKTTLHEIGHAKNIQEMGKVQVEKENDNYADFLNGHWKILRDEFLAEMYCAKLYRLFSSIEWYGDFDDLVETENFKSYTKDYENEGDGLSWNLVFQLLHQYYFVQLFQKAGFLEGLKQHIDVNTIPICDEITRILEFNVVMNCNVPTEFNTLILKKWEEFHIKDRLDRQ
jgi:hypothetical protein